MTNTLRGLPVTVLERVSKTPSEKRELSSALLGVLEFLEALDASRDTGGIANTGARLARLEARVPDEAV